MSTVQKYTLSTLQLVNIIGWCCTSMYVEVSTYVLFALAFEIPVAEKNLFYQTQSSTL